MSKELQDITARLKQIERNLQSLSDQEQRLEEQRNFLLLRAIERVKTLKGIAPCCKSWNSLVRVPTVKQKRKDRKDLEITPLGN